MGRVDFQGRAHGENVKDSTSITVERVYTPGHLSRAPADSRMQVVELGNNPSPLILFFYQLGQASLKDGGDSLCCVSKNELRDQGPKAMAFVLGVGGQSF